MHARARDVPRRDHRAALRGARGSIACGSLSVRETTKAFATGASLRARRNGVPTDAVSASVPRSEHGGAGHVEDAELVRRRAGKRRGAASLGADAMTVFSWDSARAKVLAR